MGDATALPETAPGDRWRPPARRRAGGTRERHLALTTEVCDPAGMASARLATAVGYPGSSIAFAHLLSGMERDGLIRREVRSKPTYRIALSSPLPVRAVPEPDPDPVPAADADSPRAACPAAIDYGELAGREHAHLVRRLRALGPEEAASLERLLFPPADPPSSATA